MEQVRWKDEGAPEGVYAISAYNSESEGCVTCWEGRGGAARNRPDSFMRWLGRTVVSSEIRKDVADKPILRFRL